MNRAQIGPCPRSAALASGERFLVTTGASSVRHLTCPACVLCNSVRSGFSYHCMLETHITFSVWTYCIFYKLSQVKGRGYGVGLKGLPLEQVRCRLLKKALHTIHTLHHSARTALLLPLEHRICCENVPNYVTCLRGKCSSTPFASSPVCMVRIGSNNGRSLWKCVQNLNPVARRHSSG